MIFTAHGGRFTHRQGILGVKINVLVTRHLGIGKNMHILGLGIYFQFHLAVIPYNLTRKIAYW